MPKYIDAWELNEIVTRKSYPICLEDDKLAIGISLSDFKRIVARYPVVKGLEKPQFGIWENIEDKDWFCTNCMNMIHFEGRATNLPKYCVHCGAKMKVNDLDADI